MAAAYAYAQDGGHAPVELEIDSAMSRYGAQAVFSGPAPAHLLRRITAVRNVCEWYNSRKSAESWAKWAEANPQANEILNFAMQEAERLRLI